MPWLHSLYNHYNLTEAAELHLGRDGSLAPPPRRFEHSGAAEAPEVHLLCLSWAPLWDDHDRVPAEGGGLVAVAVAYSGWAVFFFFFFFGGGGWGAVEGK